MDHLDWKARLGATHVGTVGELVLYRIDPGVYVQEVRGHVNADLMERSLRAAWELPSFVAPYGVVHILDESVTYDHDMRSFADREGIIGAAASAVVTRNLLFRMIVSAIGIAARIKQGTRVSAHEDIFEAVAAVRRAVAT